MGVVQLETRAGSAWLQRLKLKYDKLLSSFAFSFNLRPYGTVRLEDVCEFVLQTKLSHVELGQEEVLQIVNTLAGAYTRSHFSST